MSSKIFEYSSDHVPENINSSISEETEFSKLLLNGWNHCRDAGALRYDVKNLPQRRVQDGHNSYLLQLNPDRANKRRAPDVIDDVKQPFDPTKFHFGLVKEDEVIARLRDVQRGDEHVILVNVSPISRQHSLLCPSLESCLPQIMSEDSLRVALHVYFLAQDTDLRIGFNSLCAFASVNHLHYHLLKEPQTLAVETAKCTNLTGPLYAFDDTYPSRGFCFQLSNKSEIDTACKNIYKLIEYFLERDIAHNVMVTRGKCMENAENYVRVAVWPRKRTSGAKQYKSFNVAVCELSGWFPVYDEQSFNELKTLDLERELKSWIFDDFDELQENIINLFQQKLINQSH